MNTRKVSVSFIAVNSLPLKMVHLHGITVVCGGKKRTVSNDLHPERLRRTIHDAMPKVENAIHVFRKHNDDVKARTNKMSPLNT